MLLLQSCQAYDPDFLDWEVSAQPLSDRCGDGELGVAERCDIAIRSGEPGACPVECEPRDACTPAVLIGIDCERHCVYRFITTAGTGDGCCPEGVTAAEDRDCGACGDSIVGPGETCDPPSECPTPEGCRAEDACETTRFEGDPDSCTALCHTERTTRCEDDDGCCAEGCSQADDNDCPASCGDGVVDQASGETCEPSDTDAACDDVRCDDGDPCTEDGVRGDAEHCNVRCVNEPIEDAVADDACCAPGANALTDSDCEAVCGNGIDEPGEECDGEESCDDDCRLRASDASSAGVDEHCTEAAVADSNATHECKRCICERCAEEALGCYDSGDPARDEGCADLAECGYQNTCYDAACYCGDGFCLPPSGPCVSETERAAGTRDTTRILQCYSDPDCANYRARELGACLVAECGPSCDR
jgi:hypothetical protein